MKVTLKDIAQKTGYSVSTVSRVLNNSDKISSKTTEKIFQAARQLNYPILKNKNDGNIEEIYNIIIVMTGFYIGEFYSSMFSGMDNAAKRHNTQLSLVSIEKPFNKMLESIKKLSQEKYDGMVIFAPEFDKEDYLAIRGALPNNFPVISNALIENPTITTVTFDCYSGGFLAAEHFRDQGFKKCGVVKGPFEKAESRYRYNGFRDFILQAKEMDFCWEYQGDYSFESGIKAFEAYENAETKPDAVFVSNDSMCHAFINQALEKGYNIPEDLGLIGFDNLPICSRHRPTISSIHTDFETLGKVTMEKMKEILKNPSHQEGVLSLVPVNVSVRESSKLKVEKVDEKHV